jgi:hypothetical protein
VSKESPQLWPNIWRRLGAVAAGMCTVLGIAAIFSFMRPRRPESAAVASDRTASTASTPRVAEPVAPSEAAEVATPAESATPANDPPDARASRPPRHEKLAKPGEIPTSQPGEIPRVSRQGGVVVVNPWAKP